VDLWGQSLEVANWKVGQHSQALLSDCRCLMTGYLSALHVDDCMQSQVKPYTWCATSIYYRSRRLSTDAELSSAGVINRGEKISRNEPRAAEPLVKEHKR
jgi:hypothetical protein